MTLTFCAISLTVGFFSSIILMINTLDYSEFLKECPFNLYLPEIIDNDICDHKICIFNYENITSDDLPYEYLCNYNAEKNFNNNYNNKISENYDDNNDNTKKVKSKQIICELNQLDNDIIIKNDDIYRFLNSCSYLEEIYNCRRKSEHQNYNLDENFKCPNDKYYKILYTFCLLNIIINLILSFIPWKIEINVYKTLNPRRYGSRSNYLNSTKDTSKAHDNNEEKYFERFNTEFIIVGNKLCSILNDNDNESNINNNISNNNISNNINESKKVISINKVPQKNNQIQFNNVNINGSIPLNSAEIFILEENKPVNIQIKKKEKEK